MRQSRGHETNDYHNGMSFHDLNQAKQQPTPRFSPIRLSSNDRQYQDNDYNYRVTSTKKKSGFCSKPCIIGLCIGLLIGIILVIAIAVPIGVTRCGQNSDVISVTACPSTTTISTTTTSTASCIGVISTVPTWPGTFLMDSACQTIPSSCCCLNNLIIVNTTYTSQLTLSGNAYGQCASYSVSLATTSINGFQATFIWNSEAIRLILGQDSSSIAVINTARPYCSATALRRS